VTRGKFALIVLAFATPALLLIATRFVVLRPFNIPSTSNEPTLMLGDYFLVSKLAYRTGDPQRGDMAVFVLPSNPAIDYVKRVIGVPGDSVQMRGGRLYLNGVIVQRDEAALDFNFTPQHPTTVFRETLPDGTSYMIGEMSDDVQGIDTTEVFVVPAGHYFMMGDNRDNSADSRVNIGFVPRENFVGRYAFRFWNAAGVSLAGRPEVTSAAP
jgi:signal peptidase I